MRMKNRFCRMSKQLLGIACLLSTCGVTYSCSDDYDLDEKSPSFLGKSIYDELNAKGDFKTVIRLIDDLGYKEVLSKTGSKTLFVANDDAYAKFLETTTWKDGNGEPVRSYDQLTTAQKRLLLNGSMLNNAYVLEMLTTIQGPVKNLCIRQLSSMSATDSVPMFKYDELPNNLNNIDGNAITPDKRYWDNYRKPEKGWTYLALDNTAPMLTHFLQAQMNEKNITPSDVSFILGLDGTDKAWNDNSNRSFVYDAEIVKGSADVTCLNGYYHQIDKVLVTPGNMAEEIRLNPTTSLFSAMLERFSAPYYDANLTEEYKALHSMRSDSIFQKLYIAQRGQQGSISKDPSGEALGGDIPRLSFDPGWNAYSVENSTKEQDMAAMFVPSDDAMKQYFLRGAGASLIENYGNKDNTEENLLENLYQIPQNIIVKMINNLMKESFNSTVPSKYLSVMNSAQDQMFSQYKSLPDFKKGINKVLLANNGVVYVMNDMIAPPDYASVSGPVLSDQSARVMNTIIHADDNFVSKAQYANAPLRKFYSTYLLAMQSHFSLFVPIDAGLADYGYFDPVAAASADRTQQKYWTMKPANITTKGAKQVAVLAQAYRYDASKGLDAANSRPMGNAYSSAATDNVETSNYGPTKKQMMIDMVDQHILVHGDGNGSTSIEANHKYYLSRSGAPVIVDNMGNVNNGSGMVVEGGYQKDVNNDAYGEANDFKCKVTKGYDLSTGYGNGHTYFLDRPMQPTTNNVYQVFNALKKNNVGYSKFFDMCCDFVYSNNQDLLLQIFNKVYESADATTPVDKVKEGSNEWLTELQKYAIFSLNSNQTGGRYTAANTNLIRFFNNYRYTIFVPSDAAIDEAVSHGLPTLTKIESFVNENYDAEKKAWKLREVNGEPEKLVLDENGKYAAPAQLEARAMITCLINFLKYHFCDQSYFVDEYADNDYSYSQSSCTDSKTNSFIPVAVRHTTNGLEVFDARSMTNGKVVASKASPVKVATNDAKVFNLFARDYELNNASTSARSIKSSSYVVVQGLKDRDFLLFDASKANKFNDAWSSPAKAKAFLQKYRLKK